MRTLETLNFQNRFVRLGGEFYQYKPPTPVSNPFPVAKNPDVAALLDLDPQEFERQEFWQHFGGNRMVPGTQPLAMVYSGFQFGSYNPQLGDGRGLLLGEVQNEQGEFWDVYLKGCGQTRFCRGFDGRATLRSSIREYLCGEAMSGLGIPTTRALAVVGVQELIQRELPEPAAVLVRVARTHIRFGNFDYFHYTNRPQKVTELADHVISHYFPELETAADKYAQLFAHVVDRTAWTIACWQSVGFAHGVMNTDNMSILGETFDYGPYGFMDRYNPIFVPNHSDIHGRYSYAQQPQIGHWNLAKLGETLTHLVEPERLQKELEQYAARFNHYNRTLMGRKLGLSVLDSEFDNLVSGLIQILSRHKPDHTNFFRTLSGFRCGTLDALRAYFPNNPDELNEWLDRYTRLLEREDISPEEQKEAMDAINPKFILRNYLAQKAIDRALKENDHSEIERLRVILKHPFGDQPELFREWGIDPEHYASDTPEPYLGMQVSCSA
ncbi:protein adenylyltransferase SelO [Nitrospina gracilis]|uniref:protein adenylyltransferase SelO n=1 Tax=Nitrospina gracilis TaxID=35801 RepID=UPI001F1C3570|nr:YdiU family protein [Nitrospina gracilis]MCF8720843.1 uncharacterized protein YdiU (UPF0061 family) [Nitrospina gracilis Nb-211]